jgi:hypothetical protein
MMRMICAALALALIAFPAQAQRWSPQPGTQPYRYQSVQHVPGEPDRGLRLDYDLVADAAGGLTAVVLRAQTGAGEQWTDVPVDPACRAALHAGTGELARVALLPVAPNLQTFLPPCAPRDLFFPLTDLRTLALIQSPWFGIASLAAPGDKHRFAPFAETFERGDTAAETSTPGGELRFVSAEGSRATLDWAPDPMTLRVTMRGAASGGDLHFQGTSTLVLRVEIDRATGMLIGATATTDRLNLIVDVKDAPPQPVIITSEISISQRKP